jgi:hypothetical protein
MNVANGFGVEAGKPLASSPRVAKLAFIGETTTGRLITQYASQTIVPVTLELGRRERGAGGVPTGCHITPTDPPTLTFLLS